MNLSSALEHLDIEKWRPMTLERAIRQVNRTGIAAPGTATQKGAADMLHYGPKMMLPQYYTPSRGASEEIARKAGLLTQHDVDYRDIPAFIRRIIDNDLLK
jgi:hypothetical protein